MNNTELTIYIERDDGLETVDINYSKSLIDLYDLVAPGTGLYEKELFFEEELVPRDASLIRETLFYDRCKLLCKDKYNVVKYINEQIEIVKRDGLALAYVKYQTPEICLAAVRRNGLALIYMNRQTPEICLAAARQNGLALMYANNQTPEICLAAVKQNKNALTYSNYQTPEICLAARR